MAAAVVLISGGPVRPAWADFVGTELGAAGGWAVLEIGNGNVSISGPSPPGLIVGNVGIAGTSPGNFSDSGDPIKGGLYLGGSQTATLSGGASVTGGILNNQGALLSSAASVATHASATFAGLAATQSVTGNQITGTTTITASNPGGLNVIDVSNINLGNGQVLTLNGPAGTEFILNDSGGMTLNSARVVLAGGLSANDLVFNVTGNNVQTSGGLINESVLTGIILAPNENVQLTPGSMTGEIISGQNINIASGANVSGAPAPTMGTGLPALALLGGGLLLAWRLRRRPDGARPTSRSESERYERG
jgi:choice-of-anchor A domain-containing protein